MIRDGLFVFLPIGNQQQITNNQQQTTNNKIIRESPVPRQRIANANRT